MKILAYKTEDVINQSTQKWAKIWFKSALISQNQFEKIEAICQHPLHTPNVYIRILMFVLTIIASIFSMAVFSPFFLGFISEIEYVFMFFGFALSAICYFGLNHIIQNKKQYQAGVDDAILYIGISAFVFAMCMLLSKNTLDINQNILIFVGFVFPILVLASIRYIDKLCATLAYFLIMYAVFLIHVNYLAYGTYYLPFSSMICAALVYFGVKKCENLQQLQIWKIHFLCIKVIALIHFYLSGNYFIVRTLSETLLNVSLAPNQDISLAFFFYAFSFFVPVLYLFYAFFKRDVILLKTGVELTP